MTENPQIGSTIRNFLLSNKSSPSFQLGSLTIDKRAALTSTVTFLLGLIIVLYFVFKYIRSLNDRRDSILIAGVSGQDEEPGVGKTTLFKVLKTGKVPKYGVVSSVQSNECTLDLGNGKRVKLADYPGASVLRSGFSKYLDSARGVVYVVDAAAGRRNGRRDAGMLYEVLKNKQVRKLRTPVMVFCNKIDLVGSMNEGQIEEMLKYEMNQLRLSSQSGIGDIGDSDSHNLDDENESFLGVDGESFSFDQLKTPVSFAAGSALRGKVKPVQSFISKLSSS